MYFININKPKGVTSFDVIKQIRKKLNIKQIGHSGTLDPMATGVLQIGVENATKLLDYLPSDKVYRAKFKLGYISDSYDSEGNITFVQKPDISKELLQEVINSFLGKSFQLPPKYSAIKQNGKRLCDLARSGRDSEISLQMRLIEIYSIELLDYSGSDEVEIKVSCKKGTYIRSLVNDIGEKLKCGAYILELERIQAGDFSIEDANNITDENYTKISPLDAIKLPQVQINENELTKIFSGNFIANKTDIKDGMILLTNDNKLVSLAQISDNLIRPKKNFKRR